jgi:regulator of protease activity HflC (stomatin/prohibitin superfamily)
VIEDFGAVLSARVANVIRTQASNCDLDELYNQEQSLTAALHDDLSTWAEPFGMAIRAVSIVDVAPDAEVHAAMNSVIIASREREATLHAAQAERAEMVARAKADKERKRLQGEGIAAQRKAIMAGYEQSVKDFSDATGVAPDIAASISIATEYMDMLRNMARDGKNVVFTPYSPSGSTEIVDAVRNGVLQADSVTHTDQEQ